MVQKKFELIITSNDIQEILAVGDTPILVGSLDHCSIKISGDEPAIKAVIEKEDDCLAFTIYDNKYPIIIKGKKYKTAKINNPSFIKLGSIDIIINVEEVAIKETLPLDDNETDDEVFSDYSDVSIKNPFPVSIPKTIENSINEKPDLPKVSAAPPEDPIIEKSPSLPDRPEMVDVTTEISNEDIPEVVVGKPDILSEEDLTDIDDLFKFNIVFDENSFEKSLYTSYSDASLDFSAYIDLKDETINHIPVPEIHTPTDSRSVHVVHMNNGTTLSEKYFGVSEKRAFISNVYDKKNYIQIHDCNKSKEEFLYNRNEKTIVVAIDGYETQKVSGFDVEISNDKTLELVEGERIIFSRGTSQVIVQFSDLPPTIKRNNYFNIDEDLLKAVSISWAFSLFFILTVLIFPPLKMEKAKREVVIVYKRKKIEEIDKTMTPNPEVASSDSAASEVIKKSKIGKPSPKPKNKDVTKTKPKISPKKVAKKTKPTRKTVKKVSKKRPSKNTAKVRKIVNNKSQKKAPKKQYKFNFGSKLNSAMSATSSVNLKQAKSKSAVSVANTMNSATSVTSKFNASGVGKSKAKISRFAAGGRSGRSTIVGAKGLSGKTRSTTAYIEANTKILGAMDPELIRKIMREFIPQFRHCYQRELVVNPSIVGVFDLDFKINARGKGVAVKVTKKGKSFSKKGKNCLQRVVKLIKFPKPKGGGMVDVKQPMNFYKQ